MMTTRMIVGKIVGKTAFARQSVKDLEQGMKQKLNKRNCFYGVKTGAFFSCLGYNKKVPQKGIGFYTGKCL